jgi:Fe-S cluster biogenesis protein NfuA
MVDSEDPPMPEHAQEIRIIARPQAQPQKCDFDVDRTVLDGTAYFGSAQSAQGSPLPEALFAIPGVSAVLIRGSRVTVTRSDAGDWSPLAREVGAAIRRMLQAGVQVVKPGTAAPTTTDETIRAKVQEILDAEVNPAIAMHGGTISLLDVQNGVVYVRMGGGCHGCASSTATLKQGVEQMVKARVPEVVEILDTTDHASGTNPYYSPA